MSTADAGAAAPATARSVRLWERTLPMGPRPDRDHLERWTSSGPDGELARSYAVHVREGKPLDVVALKPELAAGFAERTARIRAGREGLFAGPLVRIRACPVCCADSETSRPLLDVHGGRYHQCACCSHVFVIERPPPPAIEAFYERDRETVGIYADPGTAETRMREVALPKARWTVERYEALHGRSPRRVLDVGAGGGHFVRACRDLGLDARGIEPNAASRAFARDAFGLRLEPADFLRDWRRFGDADVVTFWGVIEHVPEPMALLQTARRLVDGRAGMTVFCVPRWDSVSAAVQATRPETVARHLEPLGHASIFTLRSAATACELAGFAPAAAWFFGMDAFELATQASHHGGGSLAAWKGLIGPLQNAFDRAGLSDEVAIAAGPA